MVRRPWWAFLVLGAALALVGAVVAVVGGGDRGGADLRPPAQPVADPGRTAPIRAVVAELQRFIEQERGLTFRRQVRMQFLDDDAFERRVRRLTREPTSVAKRRERLFQALALIPPDLDLADAAARDRATSILGIYDPGTSVLIVRGTDPTPLTRMTLVHELTHALQDQAFDLRRSPSRGQLRGWYALVEGDARRIENRYRDTLKPEEASEAALEAAALDMASTALPPAIGRYVQFPYDEGNAFTTSLVELGGQTKLDAAFRAPPVSDEGVLHAERFLAREAPAAVPEPRADAHAVQRDVLGEFGLRVLLEGVAGEDEVREAATGWGGDRYVTWADGPRSCVRLNVVMDTAADADELAGLLGRWAAATGATVEGRAPIVVTSCH